jgi:hypothetical protein
MANVYVWQDDPESGLQLIEISAPQLNAGLLPTKIDPPPPDAKLYDKDTDGLRAWALAAALARAANFWGPLLPHGITWQRGSALDVYLDRDVDLNAYYDRDSLSFFHEQVGRRTYYSCESPDVVCHEFGHGVLDAVRPELWNAASLETAAFHESFGDMSAILCALQLDSIRSNMLEETASRPGRNSKLSRLAEQMGNGIRQVSPDAAESDCLRNAANSFFYQAPDTLPSMAPATQLSSEPHSLSRVFTGAFFEAFAGMCSIVSDPPTATSVAAAAADMAKLLLDAVKISPVVPEYFSQVAAGLIEADSNLGGKYATALKSAFVHRGILSPGTATAMLSLQTATSVTGATPAMRMATGGQPPPSGDLPLQAMTADQYGLDGPLFVHAPGQPRRLAAHAAGFNSTFTVPQSSEKAAHSFVEQLMRMGRVDYGKTGDPSVHILHPNRHKTHKLERSGTGYILRRKVFYCGFSAA